MYGVREDMLPIDTSTRDTTIQLIRFVILQGIHLLVHSLLMSFRVTLCPETIPHSAQRTNERKEGGKGTHRRNGSAKGMAKAKGKRPKSFKRVQREIQRLLLKPPDGVRAMPKTTRDLMNWVRSLFLS